MLAFLQVGQWEIFVVLLIALLLFGSRMPSVMRSLGKSVTEFKKGLRDVGEEADVEDKVDTEGGSDSDEDSPPPAD